MGIRSKIPTSPADEKIHFVSYILSGVAVFKRNGSEKFSVLHGDRIDRMSARTSPLEGWRLSPSFGPLCISQGAWVPHERDQTTKLKGKGDFGDATPAVFPHHEFLDSELAMQLTTLPRKLAGTSEHLQCLWLLTIITPLHPTPGRDPPLSQLHNKLHCSQGCPWVLHFPPRIKTDQFK